MLVFKYLVPLVPVSFVLLLVACANHPPEPQIAKEPTAAKSSIDVERSVIARQDVEDEGVDNSSADTPALASNIPKRALELIGIPYRFGGATAKGLDCNGFVGYLFRKGASIELPHSAHEFINMGVPLVSRGKLRPDDLLFLDDRGHGRVGHAGAYIDNGQFAHSTSRHGGGMRVDSPGSNYWGLSCTEARRILEPDYKDALTGKH